jgi:hypothetical protein
MHRCRVRHIRRVDAALTNRSLSKSVNESPCRAMNDKLAKKLPTPDVLTAAFEGGNWTAPIFVAPWTLLATAMDSDFVVARSDAGGRLDCVRDVQPDLRRAGRCCDAGE